MADGKVTLEIVTPQGLALREEVELLKRLLRE